jgi:regulator of sigma E protease
LEILNSLSWTIVWFVIVLGVMIFVHELGHHLMAKFLKIRVNVFSLGFGPRLVGFKRGETDYRVSLLPLGGYVKMAGEHYDDELTGSPDEFLSRPKSHRFAVAIAGPAMNIGLAILLLTMNFIVGVQVPAFMSEPAIVGYVVRESPAQEFDLREGDHIVSVAGDPTPTWEDLQLAIATSPGQLLEVEIIRNGESLQKLVRVDENPATGTGFLGVLSAVHNVISEVQPGPAEKAGLQAGDAIVKVTDGEKTVELLPEILDLIGASKGTSLEFTVRRGDTTFTMPIVPVEIDGQTRVGMLIGEVPYIETKLERYGPFEALTRSVQRSYQLTLMTVQVVGKLLTGQTSLKVMSGPIEIARYSGQAAAQGAQALTTFIAFISLQLGIFNLFPIPILDGGMIALILIEAVLRKDLSLKVKERIFQVGFVFLILLMGIVIINDISKNI